MTYRVIIEPTADRGIREAFRWITENRLSRSIEAMRSGPGRFRMDRSLALRQLYDFH